tara:strand:+ start:229 stop:489 length:261 start_codon:yes stop_codon:yes gene_type:complete
MDINQLIVIVKNKIEKEIRVENIRIEDKSYIHKNHSGNIDGKYHLKISIKSEELKKMRKIESNKKIYKILQDEIKQCIHSLQIFVN